MQFEILPPVPAVALAAELRRISLFSFASVDELFRLAAIARQVRHPEGAVFQKQGAPADYIQVLIDGRAMISDGEGGERDLMPPALIGFWEVLEGAPLAETARATASSICLALRADDFRALMSDNIELAEGLLRMLAGPRPENEPLSLLKGAVRPESLKHRAAEGERLRPIDKALLLQDLPIFSRATGEELVELAAITREVPLKAGETAFAEGEPPSIWMVLSGAIRLVPAREADSVLVEPGDALGIDETLAAQACLRRGQVKRDGRGLRITREDLFALFADRVDLLQGVFGALLSSGGREKKGRR